MFSILFEVYDTHPSLQPTAAVVLRALGVPQLLYRSVRDTRLAASFM
jgi:hypothetical protein